MFCGVQKRASIEAQKKVIAAYYDVVLACSRDQEYLTEHGTPVVSVDDICDYLHGMYCDAIPACEISHELIIEVLSQYMPNKEISLVTARKVCDKVGEELEKEYI